LNSPEHRSEENRRRGTRKYKKEEGGGKREEGRGKRQTIHPVNPDRSEVN